jgi:hypothetical protein
MQKLDYWRCHVCCVILAENVIVPDRGTVSADCWHCGAVATLGEAATALILGDIGGSTRDEWVQDAVVKPGKRKAVTE